MNIKSQLAGVSPEDILDISRFNPSPATYFMDGASDATIRLMGSSEELFFDFQDRNTSIAASAPLLFNEAVLRAGAYVPVPAPLQPLARVPIDTPERYRRNTTSHLMQVISMNMKKAGTANRLLIGVPYAEKYPEIFYNADLFPQGVNSAASYGVVSSLTDFSDDTTGRKEITSNGYPARSFFAIYHIIETPVGAFFNKKATQMELQPDANGKLALALPPLPFKYSLQNGPIPLFDVRNPLGEPVAEVIAAHHEDNKLVEVDMEKTDDVYPFHRPDLSRIEAVLSHHNLLRFDNLGR